MFAIWPRERHNDFHMCPATLWPYQCPEWHEHVSGIIRRRSTNVGDVRELALQGLDLARMRRVLDLGCGFGFMAEAVAERVAPDAEFLGVDLWSANENPFVRRVTARQRRATFEPLQIDSELPWPDHSFDLVISSYSLYFFPQVLSAVARILEPEGLLLAVTHSERSFLGLLHVLGLDAAESHLLALTRRFSAENGQAQLERWFGEVTRLDYHNDLRFQADHCAELFAYLRFKLPFLVPGARSEDELPPAQVKRARAALERHGELIVEKTDAVFHCRRPQCR